VSSDWRAELREAGLRELAHPFDRAATRAPL